MTNLIGLNIATEHVEDWGTCKALVQAMNAGVHVAHFANPDQFEKRALELRAVSPQSLIICRPWHEKEREYHWPHSDPARRFVAEPADLLNVYGHMGKQGCAVELWCDVDGGKYPERTAAAFREALRLADKRDIVVGGPSYATGNPPLPTEATWTPFHDEILRMFSDSPHILTVHEYGPSTEWEVGRFVKWVIERCAQLNLKVPRMAMSEGGLESPHWRARGVTQEAYARQVIDWAEKWYQPHPNVIGMALFNYGKLPPREGYNLEGAKAFFGVLVPNNPKRGSVPEPAPAPVDPPTAPTQPSKPEVQWPVSAKIGKTITVPGETVLYASPHLNAADAVGRLRAGEMVTRLEDARELSGNKWMYPVLRWAAPAGESYRGWALLSTGQTGTLTQMPQPYELRVTVEITPDQAPLIEQVVPMLMEHLSIKVVPVNR